MKLKISADLHIWIEARRRHGLSHVEVQMARELGLNPRKLGKLDNHDQERWKRPLREFIRHLYQKHFHKDAPDEVVSIEERVRRRATKKATRKAAKLLARENSSEPSSNDNDSRVAPNDDHD